MRLCGVRLLLGLAMLFAIASTVNVPKVAAQEGGYLTFEDGVDSAVIGSVIPGVTFSNTDGFDWVYGDIRTGQYNAPYPNDCPLFSSQCAYTLNGNFFAWMGPVQGVGRIDFTEGNGTFFEAGFSTADPLIVEAYSDDNQLIDSGSVAPNIFTGNLDRVRLEGAGIAYVLISGGANRWLLDDLITDAPGVPNQQGPGEDRPANAAQVTVALRPTPNYGAASGSIVSFEIEVVNRGDGMAQDATLVLPFDPATMQLLDATFSTPDAWVSSIAADSMTIRTGAIASKGGTVTATVRFRVADTAAVGSSLAQRLRFTWSDGTGGGSGNSNTTILAVAGSNDNRETYVLSGDPAAAPVGGSYTFSSSIFVPNEPVGVWWNLPDGTVEAGPTFYAEADGSLVVDFDSGDLPPGAYSFVMYGHWSEFTAVAPFTVQ